MDRYEAQIRGFCIEGWLIQERFIEGRSTLYGQGKVGGILFISQDQWDKEPGLASSKSRMTLDAN